MDKNRARITIKLGQANEQKPKDKIPVIKEEKVDILEPVDSLSVPVEQKPVQEEDPEPQKAKREISASKEPAEEFESFGAKYASFDDDEDTRFSGRRFGPSRLKNGRERNAKGLIGVFASVAGAIALGIVFGYIVLSFFKSGMLDNPATPEKSLSKTEETLIGGQGSIQAKPQENVTVGSATGEVEKTAAVSITLPDQAYFMVQGGVFQDQASAAPIMEKIKSKGWPSTFSGGKPAYLYLGLAMNRDNALAMANQLQELDVYIKEYKEEPKTISVQVKQGVSLTQEEWDRWFKQEQTFVAALGSAIGKGLTDGKLDANQMKEVKDAHRMLLQYGREIVTKLSESQQALGNRLLNDYTKGVSAMDRYQKQPAAGYLWQAEQALLDGFQSKSQLFASFK